MLPRLFSIVVIACLILAGIWRTNQNQLAVDSGVMVDRASVLLQIDSNRDAMPESWTQVQRLRFDPDAPVVISLGKDQRPGQKNVNDDWNTGDIETDNRSEIGATGSDDLCLGPLDPGYATAVANPKSLVVGNGAFVASVDEKGTKDRFLIHGQFPDGQPWYQLVVH